MSTNLLDGDDFLVAGCCNRFEKGGLYSYCFTGDCFYFSGDFF